jgi:hypothetical protein
VTTWFLVLLIAGQPAMLVGMPSESACRAALAAAPASNATAACVQREPREAPARPLHQA